MLKVYDNTKLIMENSSNHEVMFPEYSRNIPRILVLKIFQGYPGILERYENILRSRKIHKIVLYFVCYPMKILILVASSLAMLF